MTDSSTKRRVKGCSSAALGRRLALWLLICMAAGPAGAFLPPDADAWAPRLIEERRRGEEDFQRRLKERNREAAQAREQVRRDIVIPPWMRLDAVEYGTQDATLQNSLTAERAEIGPGQKSKRAMAPILLLTLMAAAAAWVAWATREPATYRS